MGKNKQKKSGSGHASKSKSNAASKRSTLEEVEAVSSSDEGSVDLNNKTWNAQAEALKERLKSGAFDHLLSGEAGDEESIEEVVLDDEQDNSREEIRATKPTEQDESENPEEDDEEEEEQEEDNDNQIAEEGSESRSDAENGPESDNSNKGEEVEDDEDDVDPMGLPSVNDTNSKALLAKTEEMAAPKINWPWIETFDVIPPTPLPFGMIDEQSGSKIDVHDDLKREVAFYDLAMEAVHTARMKCKEIGVPFSRPDDFFAEMVKTDEHMARVKDRLIFENKKIEAVAQRKSNREQKLRAKEAQSNKVAEKSKRKKDNLKAVENWAQSAAANRGGKYTDDDGAYLKQLNSSVKNQNNKKRGWIDRDGNLQTGPNKKRMHFDKKYGQGKRGGLFKQNDPRDRDNMSSYSPKGNFGGLGSKKGGGGSGAKRQGKRARDAGRSRQRAR